MRCLHAFLSFYHSVCIVVDKLLSGTLFRSELPVFQRRTRPAGGCFHTVAFCCLCLLSCVLQRYIWRLLFQPRRSDEKWSKRCTQPCKLLHSSFSPSLSIFLFVFLCSSATFLLVDFTPLNSSLLFPSSLSPAPPHPYLFSPSLL